MLCSSSVIEHNYNQIEGDQQYCYYSHENNIHNFFTYLVDHNVYEWPLPMLLRVMC